MNDKKAITKEMLISQVLQEYPETFEVFIGHEIGCVGCAMAQQETIEEGMIAHGIDPDKFVEVLNEKVEATKKENQ
jgi:hybrid cluster-associated redox disulfide protein